LVNDVVGVFLFTVKRRLPLVVGVDTGHLDEDDDGMSADETSALVDACGDVCTGPFAVVGVTNCCRV